MIERQAREVQLHGLIPLKCCSERRCLLDLSRNFLRISQIIDDQRCSDRRHLIENSGDLCPYLNALSSVPVAIGRDEQDGLYLAETIQNALLAKVRRAG